MDLFPPIAARGAGQIMLVSSSCLAYVDIFSPQWSSPVASIPLPYVLQDRTRLWTGKPSRIRSGLLPFIPSSQVLTDISLGPLVLVAVIYQILGISSAWLVRHLFWTPHRFRYGILIAGGWGNTGDIRGSPSLVLLSLAKLTWFNTIATAVITAVTASAPFAGPKDSGLSVAYISTLMLISMVRTSIVEPCSSI